MDDIDILRSAHLIVKQHGEQAEFVAAGRVDDMIERGDPAGEATWKRIVAAIRDFRRTELQSGKRFH